MSVAITAIIFLIEAVQLVSSGIKAEFVCIVGNNDEIFYHLVGDPCKIMTEFISARYSPTDQEEA